MRIKFSVGVQPTVIRYTASDRNGRPSIAIFDERTHPRIHTNELNVHVQFRSHFESINRGRYTSGGETYRFGPDEKVDVIRTKIDTPNSIVCACCLRGTVLFQRSRYLRRRPLGRCNDWLLPCTSEETLRSIQSRAWPGMLGFSAVGCDGRIFSKLAFGAIFLWWWRLGAGIHALGLCPPRGNGRRYLGI